MSETPVYGNLEDTPIYGNLEGFTNIYSDGDFEAASERFDLPPLPRKPQKRVSSNHQNSETLNQVTEPISRNENLPNTSETKAKISNKSIFPSRWFIISFVAPLGAYARAVSQVQFYACSL